MECSIHLPETVFNLFVGRNGRSEAEGQQWSSSRAELRLRASPRQRRTATDCSLLAASNCSLLLATACPMKQKASKRRLQRRHLSLAAPNSTGSQPAASPAQRARKSPETVWGVPVSSKPQASL